MEEDEDSRLFLKMLDAAAERIFIEACSEVAAEASAIAVVCNTETNQQSLRKLCSQCSSRHLNSPLSQASSSLSEPRKRRKRFRTSDQPVQQQPFPATDIGLRAKEKTRPPVGWPQNFTAQNYGVRKSADALQPKENETTRPPVGWPQQFTAQSYGVGKTDNVPGSKESEKTRPPVGWTQNFTAQGYGVDMSVNVLKPKEDEKTRQSVGWPQNFTAQSFGNGKSVNVLDPREVVSLAKNSNQPVCKADFRLQRNSSNAGSIGYFGKSILPGAMLAPIVGIDAKSETEGIEKSDEFSREFHDAIGRIESLIPSLQKLVNCGQTGTDLKSVGNLELQNIYSRSTPNDEPVTVLGKAKIWDVTRNELDSAGEIADVSKEVNRSSTPLAGEQNARLKQALPVKGNAKSFRKEFKGPNERLDDARAEIRVTCLSGQRDGIVRTEGIQTGKSQVRGQNVQAQMDRLDSLRQTSSRNASVRSHTRNMPGQCSKNGFSQEKATRKQLLRRDAASRYQSPVPSVGSSSFRRPNRGSKFDSFKCEPRQSHARGRMMQFRESPHRNTPRRKSLYSRSRGRTTLQNQTSEDSSSPATTSGTSSQQSGYSTSLSGSYQSNDSYSSVSDETEEGYRKVHQSPRRKWSGSSASNTDYESSSHYSSQDQYSDTGPSSQRSSVRPHRQEHDLQEGKRVGKISKLRKKLGTMFHYHHLHHHHNHYSDSDEPDVAHATLFKRLGKMFQRTGKSDRKKLKAEKSHEHVSKSVAKKKQHKGHFRALLEGLKQHMKHSKKSKKAKDDIGRLASLRHKGKKATKKLPLWPKMGRGKAKLPNKGKGKVKFGARKRRPQFAAAKMILMS